ncbi:RagB/SusD family nutrient uptake outer membrane protein [Aureibaculum algae]|uniref:RagB/SusD family nutrient uptake outer membrane protein n=1 Tax=Aureibaculum algae TaxID=2584122 RepID=A0A5B7TYD4_9FLAO|nr:RagB/SusD family nutrient uptake outer membrane protein [Aureibaculum algae]QCX40364.1 RagB/SusD family nutrient uptake outer membrane protein [Aureibaculum algae]
MVFSAEQNNRLQLYYSRIVAKSFYDEYLYYKIIDMKKSGLKRSVNWCFILVGVFIFTIVSCSSSDEPDPVPSTEYKSILELENAVDSLHIELAIATRDNNFFAPAWGADDITTSYYSSKADYREIDQRLTSPYNERLVTIWKSSYKIIHSVNNIFFNAANLEVSDMNKKDMLLGEAYFIRGFMYHYLTRVFGKVPLQLDPEPHIEFTLSETVNIYKQIESDWLEAERMLPESYPGVETGAPRPNNGTARAFLARLYLDWGGFPLEDASKYQEAASSAKKVMENHDSHGFDLMEDLDDLWTLEHRFNKESVFTIEHCVDCIQGGNRKMGKLGNPGELGGWEDTFSEIKFFETFPENHRKNATFITDPMIEDPYTTPSGGPTVNWTAFIIQQNPILAKITGKGDIPRSSFESDRNDYMMRYAEVLLIYAEASARAGNINQDAWEALNKIRRRAELLPPDTPNPDVDLSSGDLAELAFTERGWEFAGEFLRWFDLTRMERVDAVLRDAYRNDISSTVSDPNHPDYGQPVVERVQIIGSTGKDNYFSPLPQRMIDEYPNLEN